MKNIREAGFMVALLLAAVACAHRTTVKTPQAAPPPQIAATTRPAREERLVFAYDGEEGKTALELLKVKAQVRIAASSMGELVEEINGVASGNGRNFLYFVNGAMAKTGAANYVTKRGDRIEWKLVGPGKQP